MKHIKEEFLGLDETQGIAQYKITYKNLDFIGIAKCHPDDKDFQSKLVGAYIAETRAWIKFYQHKKNNILKPKIQVLKEVLEHCKNKKSYEYFLILKTLRRNNFELDTVNKEIVQLKQDLKTYVEGKEQFYQKIRKYKKEKK